MSHPDSLPTTSQQAPSASPVPTPVMRDRAIELLTQHYASDAIQIDEFERRTAAVFAARSTDELQALVADLAPPVVPALVPEHGRISAIFSNNDQQSAMAVPRYLEVVAILGNAELDLRDATLVEGVTTIEVRATLANVELTLPAGVRLEMGGTAILGSFTSYAPSSPAPSPRVVRIVGRSVLANVEVTTAPARLPAAAVPALPPR